MMKVISLRYADVPTGVIAISLSLLYVGRKYAFEDGSYSKRGHSCFMKGIIVEFFMKGFSFRMKFL